MTTPVKLYVYDLSNGLARQLSLQLTGRQIDGVWHTSIVVFEKEVFYGQGISITPPGQSHHGSPLRIVDMGETAIDEETFNEYLAEMRQHYTADKYHLLDFNCNSFTNDCIGFLTGGNIPDYIKALPSDFLSTPFGAALRPTIDAMFTGHPAPAPSPAVAPLTAPPTAITSGAAPPAPTIPDAALAASLLQAVAAHAATPRAPNGSLPVPSVSRASAPAPAPVPAPYAPVAAPMNITTNPASFRNLLRSNRVVVAFFTSATRGPCRMIEPVFEELARSKSRANGGVAFAKIDLSVGLGGTVASEYQVRVTPTFIFFLDGVKKHELKGINAPELRTQVDLLIFEAFPPHPHMSLSLPAVESLSLNPILFSQVPNLDTMFTKLTTFIDGISSWNGPVTRAQIKQTLSKTVLPFLKASTATPPAQQQPSVSFDHWTALASCLASNLGLSELFPLADIWRIALLNANFAAWNASKKGSESSIKLLMDKALQGENVPRNYLLTVLRMVTNTFSNQVLAREVILFTRDAVTKLLVDSLLNEDATVRTAAASLAFNIAAYLQKLRENKVKARDNGTSQEENDGWEFELVVATLHAVEREQSNEETGKSTLFGILSDAVQRIDEHPFACDLVHRLTACLGLLLRLSPYTEQFTPLLGELRTRDVLKGKLEKGGCGESGAVKKEVRRLVLEVAEKLCPES